MTTTPAWARTPRARTASILLAAIAIALWWTPPAPAATIAPNYVETPLTYANATPVQSCRGWGGDTDDAGRFYSVCLFLRDLDGNGTGDQSTPALVEYSDRGAVQQIGWLPADYWFGQSAPANYVALDVAVAPDGATAYVTTGPNIDNLGQNPGLHPYTKQPLANGATSGTILRLKRRPDGSWLHDPTWKAGPFLIGDNYWAARRLDVDGSGRVYVSTNAIVHELSPLNGAIVTSFGGGATTNGPGGAWIEGIDKAQGLDVSADGSRIYVVDQQHQIVQRWLRVGVSDWRRDTAFLLGVPSQIGDFCSTNDHFQSPYDVATDAAGDVYVMDTTCNRVQRFTSAGAFVQTVWQFRTAELLELSHGFAVSWNGSIVLPTETSLLTRQDPPTRPAPALAPKPNCTDRTSPRITATSAPARSEARLIEITVTAVDDCGVTHMRVLGNRVGTPRWIAATSTSVALSGWNGRRTLVVQVRDSGNRIASRRITVVLALPQPPLKARSVVRLAGGGCSATAPMRRVAGGAGRYLLVDRCARIVGRALRVERSGRSFSVELLVPATTARAIYENAVGPVKIWVVTDSRTRITRRISAGRAVTVIGSLVAQRDLGATFGIPVDTISGG